MDLLQLGGLNMTPRLILYATCFAACFATAVSADAAQYLERTTRQNERAFSPAVITEGGKMIWLAGHAGLEDASGKNLAGNFEAQAKAAFASIERTLKRAGGSLENIVYMTVFIGDVRYGEEFVKVRREIFSSGNFTASTLVTVTGFSRPGMLLEIAPIAVIGAK
jgi:2-iminobutanoate/2-iminopropanoate deaminase